MARAIGEQRARRAALLNGLLVFGVPTALNLLVFAAASRQPWPDAMTGAQPSLTRVITEAVQFEVVFAALAVVAAWRTHVHALRYQIGDSRGWMGVAEAAACGFAVAVLYLAPGILTRPSEAPAYVIFYGGVATALGAIVGLVLLAGALVVLRRRSPGEV